MFESFVIISSSLKLWTICSSLFFMEVHISSLKGNFQQSSLFNKIELFDRPLSSAVRKCNKKFYFTDIQQRSFLIGWLADTALWLGKGQFTWTNDKATCTVFFPNLQEKDSFVQLANQRAEPDRTTLDYAIEELKLRRRWRKGVLSLTVKSLLDCNNEDLWQDNELLTVSIRLLISKSVSCG